MNNQVTLSQAIGFAITLSLAFGAGWVSMSSRVSALETKSEMNGRSLEAVMDLTKEIATLSNEVKNLRNDIDKMEDRQDSQRKK